VVVGRRDDVLVSGGVNIPLSVVEAAVAAIPGVAAASVVGRPDDEWGQVVVAVVARAGGTARTPDLDDVREAVAAKHPRSWAPRALVVVDAMPMLDSGKVDRQAAIGLADAR
jgi:O-succinylbenzoic acid--CoA ligase